MKLAFRNRYQKGVVIVNGRRSLSENGWELETPDVGGYGPKHRVNWGGEDV